MQNGILGASVLTDTLLLDTWGHYYIKERQRFRWSDRSIGTLTLCNAFKAKLLHSQKK